MMISSRTPEGQPIPCPLCGANVVIEPSILVGDAPCPRCGQLLWFIQSPETTRVFDARESSITRDRVIDIVANQLGVDRDKIPNHPNLLNELGADSLDTVELIMEPEEEFELPR